MFKIKEKLSRRIQASSKKKVLFILLTLLSVLCLKNPIGSNNLNGEINDGFVFVEGGTFIMGLPDGEPGFDEDEDEVDIDMYVEFFGYLPAHEISLDSFYISPYEVTQEEWMKYMDFNPSLYLDPKFPVTGCYAGGPLDDYETVNAIVFPGLKKLLDENKREDYGIDECLLCYYYWFEAIEFCNRKSMAENLTPCYTIDRRARKFNDGFGTYLNWKVECDWTANGYRLPTEAEWEYAARGGQLSKSYVFSGSNNNLRVAAEFPSEVGTRQPNELGIYDMSGNAAEMCWNYMYQDPIDHDEIWSKGADGYPAVRGYNEYDLLSTRFNTLEFFYGSAKIGFRLVRTAVD